MTGTEDLRAAVENDLQSAYGVALALSADIGPSSRVSPGLLVAQRVVDEAAFYRLVEAHAVRSPAPRRARAMDEAVMALLETFAEIEREFGADLFRDVVERARIAVAAEVMVEAERRALARRTPRRSGNVVFLRAEAQGHSRSKDRAVSTEESGGQSLET